MVILITLLLSYIFFTQHILGPQTYRTEDTKIGLQYTHADTRQFKQKRRRERSKRCHLKGEFALFQTTLVFMSSIKGEITKFHVVLVHTTTAKMRDARTSVVSQIQTCCFSAVMVAVVVD